MVPPAPPTPHVIILDDLFISKFRQVIVIGGIHGCFDEMIEFLEKIDRHKAHDEDILKIFVGDLVNKGPKFVPFRFGQGSKLTCY